MKRKDFLKKTILAASTLAILPRVKALDVTETKESTYNKLLKQVGFNHLPNKEIKTMKTVLHKANTRGTADHGWLKANFSFSFANYYNPERTNFGVLRVLNDDIIAKGAGFGTHPHDNMEIITIPLKGALEHKDSMGNIGTIQKDEIQVMSAGTGIQHSEYNPLKDEDTNTLQIWMFPNKKNVEPRYDQLKLDANKRKNEFNQILSPNKDDEGVWVHQDAWFSMANLEKGKELEYEVKREGNGAYIFLIEGDIKINGQELNKRDAYGLWDTKSFKIESLNDAEILLMDVPMAL